MFKSTSRQVKQRHHVMFEIFLICVTDLRFGGFCKICIYHLASLFTMNDTDMKRSLRFIETPVKSDQRKQDLCCRCVDNKNSVLMVPAG